MDLFKLTHVAHCENVIFIMLCNEMCGLKKQDLMTQVNLQDRTTLLRRKN